MESQSILPQRFAAQDRQAVHDVAIALVEHDPESILSRYVADPRSRGGRYVCADLFKESFPDFARSPSARNRYDMPVENPAIALAAKCFHRNLVTPPRGEESVILLTGIPGAGKTTQALGAEWPASARMISEEPLSQSDLALRRVSAVLHAGLLPVIVVVHVRPDEALLRTLTRFTLEGRGARIARMAEIQGDLPDALGLVRERFGNTVRLRIIDRLDPDRPTQRSGWHHLDHLRSEGNRDEILERLQSTVEYLRVNRHIDEDAWRQARGLEPRIEHFDTRGGSRRLGHAR